jgi:4-amino-4-deoxy-L-arabinose transferase-like glycosyltransferase
MMFFGDFGRDFLAARDMLMSGVVPLVGIPSSVVWLHQGPLSIYLIAISLWVGTFNPSAPAYLYAGFGVITTYLVFKTGSELFDRKVGILSAIFFTMSPLVLVNVRMPYHTAPIPFFSSIFLIFLWGFLKEKKYPFLLGVSVGLLLLLELSNAVLVPLLIIRICPWDCK